VLDSIHMPTEHSNHSTSLLDLFPSRKLSFIVLKNSIFATPVTKLSALYGNCKFSNKPRIGAQHYPDNPVYNFTILKFNYSICKRMSGSPKQFHSRFQIRIVYIPVTRISSIRPTCHPASFFLISLVR
jgi:hypothetical protein